MKINFRTINWLSITSVALLSAFSVQPSMLFAQGSLTPPGPPTPTMKTLDQVEPRIPIATNTTPGDSTSLFLITNSGSYYLTGNITGAFQKNGIRILTGDVTLDLNGFALIGVSNSGNGIQVFAGANNVRIRNGTVRDWGNNGVDVSRVQNGAFEDLRLFNNGTLGAFAGFGLDAGTNSLVRACQSWGNSLFGIGTERGGMVIDCLSRSNTSAGIAVGTGCIVRNCTSSFNQGDGIKATDNCLVLDNNASGNRNGSKSGILLIFSGGTRVENNNVCSNDFGITSDDDGNFIVRNSAHSNATNYNITGFDTVGPIVSTGGVITTNNPWANFSY